MAGLYTKVLKYLEANSKTVSEFENNIRLQNDSDGNGDYIHTWNVSGLEKPITSQLNALNSEANVLEAEKLLDLTRRNAYPSFGDQMDMQYHDLVDDTTTWKDAVQAVKDANPKP